MRVSISLPDKLFERLERFRQEHDSSRSSLYVAALREYVARHGSEEITEAWNRLCEEVDTDLDEFGKAAARMTLERTEW